MSAFAGGSTGVPVVPGELSVRYLGVALESWSPDARPLVGEVGELVVTAPMPSMPVSFWDDPDGARYRAAYFAHAWEGGASNPDKPVWRHGDWVTVTERGSLVIHGRSDATLNRHGIRMGSADIYEVVEALDEIAEAFESFDTTPLASASIAQVHAATLHGGREVVVKVLRPGIRAQIADDIALLSSVAAICRPSVNTIAAGPSQGSIMEAWYS